MKTLRDFRIERAQEILDTTPMDELDAMTWEDAFEQAESELAESISSDPRV